MDTAPEHGTNGGGRGFAGLLFGGGAQGPRGGMIRRVEAPSVLARGRAFGLVRLWWRAADAIALSGIRTDARRAAFAALLHVDPPDRKH